MGEVDGKMGNWLSELYIEASWKNTTYQCKWLSTGEIIGGSGEPHGKKLIYGRIRLLESNLNNYNRFQRG